MVPKAVYTIGELAKLTGLSRYKTLRMVEKAGVKVHRSGKIFVVFLSELQAAFPELWRSLALRNAVEGGAKST
jgi:excisionase family DNA binding protein